MLLGQFERAWSESDAIDARGEPDSHRLRDGGSFAGKHVMLRCLHGLGDTLQFIRFAPRIRELAASLTLEVQPALKTLFSELLKTNTNFADQVITWGDPEPYWNTQVEVSELPRIFRVSANDLLTHWPYLSRNGANRRRLAIPGTPLRAGLIWAGGGFDPARSIPAHFLNPLIDTPGVQWYSLQAGEQHAEAARWGNQVNKICDRSTCILTVAREMAELDLIVTVDTMNAHLAGSLGCPVWTLLPFACDWRWMLEREDTPWYPSMRLFRQPESGHWEQPIRRLVHQLSALAEKHGSTVPLQFAENL